MYDTCFVRQIVLKWENSNKPHNLNAYCPVAILGVSGILLMHYSKPSNVSDHFGEYAYPLLIFKLLVEVRFTSLMTNTNIHSVWSKLCGWWSYAL